MTRRNAILLPGRGAEKRSKLSEGAGFRTCCGIAASGFARAGRRFAGKAVAGREEGLARFRHGLAKGYGRRGLLDRHWRYEGLLAGQWLFNRRLRNHGLNHGS